MKLRILELQHNVYMKQWGVIGPRKTYERPGRSPGMSSINIPVMSVLKISSVLTWLLILPVPRGKRLLQVLYHEAMEIIISDVEKVFLTDFLSDMPGEHGVLSRPYSL